MRCQANERSRILKSGANGMSRGWDVAALKRRPGGISQGKKMSRNNVEPAGS